MNNHNPKVSASRRAEILMLADRYKNPDGSVDTGKVVIHSNTPMSIVREVLGIKQNHERKDTRTN